MALVLRSIGIVFYINDIMTYQRFQVWGLAAGCTSNSLESVVDPRPEGLLLEDTDLSVLSLPYASLAKVELSTAPVGLRVGR